MLKKGDKLVCIENYYPKIYSGVLSFNRSFTVDKIYTISRIMNYIFYMENDDMNISIFDIDMYEKWFITLNELRNKKLKRLNNVQV